jgi:uncharacterized membrane protein YeaQ/YmgE (transglycosylase-associated protein family)
VTFISVQASIIVCQAEFRIHGYIYAFGVDVDAMTICGGFTMHLLWTVLIGFAAGFVAKMILKGGPSGFIWTAVLGVAGSVLASFIGQALGWYKGGDIAGFIGSVVGAMVLLWGYGKFVANK